MKAHKEHFRKNYDEGIVLNKNLPACAAGG